MKVLILGDINSPHIKRWAIGLVESRIDIEIFGFSTPIENWYSDLNIKYTQPISFDVKTLNKQPIKKLKYLKTLNHLKKHIKESQPDILHAHYATGYGLLGALSDFKPYLISVWGSDVYIFPKKSLIHKKILGYSLSKANIILSTSFDMAKETKKYTNTSIKITPFGTDTTFFIPSTEQKKECITIGTVKSFEPVYGIDLLIKAFADVLKSNPSVHLQLTGNGTQTEELMQLVAKLNIQQHVTFTGRKTGKELVKAYQDIDIAVFPSRVESFGVAIAEASSTGIAVIGSNVGGIPEVIKENETGLLVEAENISQLVAAINKLINDPNTRALFGKNGRQFIVDNYDNQICIEKMVEVYNQTVTNTN